MKSRGLVLAGIVVAAILLFPGATAASWERGEGWGYKWIVGAIDYGGNYTFNGTTDGNNVLGLYIKYQGEEDGLYNFSYFGSFYEYNFINGTLDRRDYPFERMWMDYRSKGWVNFDGYFLLERCNVTDMWMRQHEVYAIKYQFIHVYTKENLERRGSGYLKLRNDVVEFRMNYSIHFDIKLMLNYSQPLVYYPVGSDEMAYYSTVNYSGHVGAGGSGYFKYGNFSGGMVTNMDLNGTVDDDVSSNLQITVKFSSEGNTTERPGVLELIPFYFTSSSYLIFDNLEFYLSYALGSIGQMNSRAEMGNDFYSSITIPEMVIGSYKHTSQEASEEEIEDMRTKAPEIYGPESGGWFSNYAVVISIIIAAVIVAAVALLVARRSHRGIT